MARINIADRRRVTTHAGAPARSTSPREALRRTVCATLLWEDQAYESGETIAERIQTLVPQCPVAFVCDLAIEARTTHHLRHVPLLLLRELARHPQIAQDKAALTRGLAACCVRPDDLTEFLALYFAGGGTKSLTRPIKRGLAQAFTAFTAYQLAKWDSRRAAISLQDFLRLVHPKPRSAEQRVLWTQCAKGTLPGPDTWEVALSRNELPAKDVWERLLAERKLGGLALLRNLRNMDKVGVSHAVIKQALTEASFARVLPFQFFAAFQNAPAFYEELDAAFFQACEALPRLRGTTIVIVDLSGSMGRRLSARSDMRRMHAACMLAVLVREVSEDCILYATAGDDIRRRHATHLVASFHGFALAEALMRQHRELGGGGIFLTQVMEWVARQHMQPSVGLLNRRSRRPPIPVERIIVITDEEDCENDPEKSAAKANAFGQINYLINIASSDHTLNFGKWVGINGFSAHVVSFIQEHERLNAQQAPDSRVNATASIVPDAVQVQQPAHEDAPHE